MSEIKNSSTQIKLPLLLSMAVAIGLLFGAGISGNEGGGENPAESATKLKEVLTLIDRNYVDDVDINEITENTIRNMLHNLDPHSYYIPAMDLNRVNSELQGNYEGIGIQFDVVRDTIYVVTALGGGPSEKMGIKSGDKIVSVDGDNVGGIGIDYQGVYNRLLGPKGSQVRIEIKRRGERELLPFLITRDKIPTNSVDVYYMITPEIGYIKFRNFSSTTYDEVVEAISKLEKDGMKKLVLDLQDNRGGYMIPAVNLADEFLQGNKLILTQKDKDPKRTEKYFSKRKGLFEKGPLIVLIDEGSASSAEILAGALQDHDRALIVGRRSFGKGLVQVQYPLSDGSEIRLTISRYYTPSGRSIQKPYGNGNEYENDWINRYNHGEFFSADSVKFADSLKYETAKGRVVYGGGGIMPDHFVPLDSSFHSTYYTHLFGNNVLREFSYLYYENNKASLKEMGFEKYNHEFKVTGEMFDKVIAIGEEGGVVYNESGFLKSKPLMELTIKAFIARSIWGEKEFYQVFNESDEVLQQSLKLFDKAEQLALAN